MATGLVYTANGIENILFAPRSPRAVFSNQEDPAIDSGFPFCGAVGTVMGRCKDASNQITQTLLGLGLVNLLPLPDTLK